MNNNTSCPGIYIGLGANLPRQQMTPVETLRAALDALADAGISPVQTSSFWRSPAWPDPAKPEYVNAVCRVVSDEAPGRLMQILLDIETRFGRVREARWDSRSLDLDLIDYRGEVRDEAPHLILPHPRALERAFVLLPLREIAPDWRDPVSGDVIETCVARLNAADRAATTKL